jgi:hypothetical protein
MILLNSAAKGWMLRQILTYIVTLIALSRKKWGTGINSLIGTLGKAGRNLALEE